MKKPAIICFSFFCAIFSTPSISMHSALAGEKPYTAFLKTLNENPQAVDISHERQFKISLTFQTNSSSKKTSKSFNEDDIKQFIKELDNLDTEKSKKIADYLRNIL